MITSICTLNEANYFVGETIKKGVVVEKIEQISEITFEVTLTDGRYIRIPYHAVELIIGEYPKIEDTLS